MAGEFRIRLKNAVGGGIVASCVHGIGASFIQRGRESDIFGDPAGDGDFRHLACATLTAVAIGRL
jgi:hypothetical protein